MKIDNPLRGTVREDFDKNKKTMDIIWNILQTVVTLIIAGGIIVSIWK